MTKPYNVLIPDPQAQKKLVAIINRRRGPIVPIPGLNLDSSYQAGDVMFDRFGLSELSGCVTAEPTMRPVPQVFKQSDVQGLADLYAEYAPQLFTRLFARVEPPYQAISKVSRRGYPLFQRYDDPVPPLIPFFKMLDGGDVDWIRPGFIIINIRLQAEPKSKSRTFMVYDREQGVIDKVYDQATRTIEVRGLGERVCSRVRLVFNMPVANLYKQVVDSMIHNALLQFPAFHHDMFNSKVLPVKGDHLALDVKHFERNTAACVPIRSAILGGVYQKISDIFDEIPFAVPSMDWKQDVFLYPNRQEGMIDQFSSGRSEVAPIQKEIFAILYATFFMKQHGVDFNEGLTRVFSGGTPDFTIRNYGDDNSISGDGKQLEAFFQYAGQYLTVEREDPPKFLGFVYYPDLGWKLPPESYLTKTYLPERGGFTPFRRFPYLGWVLKRDNFRQFGHPSIVSDVFPFEDKTLAGFGLSWTDVLRQSHLERARSAREALITNPWYILGKDYHLTAQEQVASGRASGLGPEVTIPMVRNLLGTSWHKHIKWL